MSGLILHCGGKLVDWEEVVNAETPEPVDTHFPIPHARVLELAVEGLEAQGLHVEESEHALANGGDRYFGLMQLAIKPDSAIMPHADFQLIAAVRNTHDKSYAASMALGSRVFVCDNLAFSGEVTFARKHTRHAYDDLPRLVADALGRLGALHRTQEQRIEGYQGKRLSDDKAYAAIVRASLAKVIPNARIKDVVDQWHVPNHDDFKPRTAWSLMNGFTEVLKASPIEQLARRTSTLHGILDVACGLDFKALKHVEVNEDTVGVN